MEKQMRREGIGEVTMRPLLFFSHQFSLVARQTLNTDSLCASSSVIMCKPKHR